MKGTASKRLHCAIYTRASTEHGLDQDFNSLDAQREAAEAYIKSQAHEGWGLIRTAYNDGGFSGGSVERPGLQQLLSDVQAGSVDVVVVYKVDRLTRSLADFAKLVELFDAHHVSFVSVTQAFNTTSSMGRLTLNVLLSFAQFEREVTSERIRDKIGASKRRGLWVGGMVPLGYESRDKKLVMNEGEAERVRLIFRRYLELASLGALLKELHERGIVTKVRHLSNGRTIGGNAFTRGPLAYLLRNRFYIGEVVYRGEICPAQHTPVLDRELFEAVQQTLASPHRGCTRRRGRSGALLISKLYDDGGNRMTPTHANKRGVRYRYYVSSALSQGRPPGSVNRVPAPEIERIVLRALRERYPDRASLDDVPMITGSVDKVVIRAATLDITLLADADRDAQPVVSPSGDDMDRSEAGATSLTVSWARPRARARRDIILANGTADMRPIRAETRATLVRSIAVGRRWLQEMVDGSAGGPVDIAAREGCSRRHVMMMVSLSSLAPDLVRAAMQGRLPRGIGVTRLIDAPIEWSRQRQMLGL
jgi:DNA invertase Pin-like site-specific DNA recombinase